MNPTARRFNSDELLAILSLSKDATAIYTTEELIIQTANDAMIGFWGKDRGVIGKSFMEAVPELIGQPFFDLLKEVWRTGITYEAKDTAAQLKVNGELQWFYYDFIYRAIKNEAGEVYCILHTATDVTELHHNLLAMEESKEREQNLAEELTASNEELAATNEELIAVNEELQQSQESLYSINVELENRVAARVADLSESEERFRNMAESTDVMIAVADESSKGVYFNKAWVDITGKSEQDLLAFGWAELIHPDDKERWLNTYLEAFKKQAPVSGEFRILSKNGDYRWLLAKIPARHRLDGSFAGYISSCVDITSRKTDELQLAQIINILPASVVVIRGPELVVETINESNLAYWNKTKEQVVGKPLLEILPELAAQAFPGQLRQVMETGEIVDVKESPVIFIAADGTERETFVDYTYQPLTDINGKRTGVLVMSSEITDRVISRKLLEKYANDLEYINGQLSAANDDLARSEARFKYLIREAPVAIGVLNGRELLIESANEMILQVWGKPKTIIGLPLAVALPELKGQPFLQLLDDVYTSGNAFYGNEARALLEHEGQIKENFFNFVYQPIKNEFGAVTDIIVAAVNVTGQVNARRAVEQAQEMLRLSIEAANVGTWNIDARTRAFLPSARLKELFGYQPDEDMPYNAAVDQIDENYREKVLAAVESSITRGESYHIEYPIIGFRDQELRWVRALGKVTNDAEGDLAHFSGVMMDITEQKQDEIRKNDFIGMVSHELKTPLTSLTAIVQVANAKLKDNPDNFLAGAMEKANVQVKKMSTMINGFLNISRLESGKILIDKHQFNLEDLIGEMIKETELTVSSHVITFERCGTVIVNADRDKIGSVINNLVSNAIKYSPKAKLINVKCEITGQSARVSIKDGGIGIKQQDIGNLFQRYYRVQSDHTRNISGFGIGLYLSAEIINRHQGKIWAESEPGMGSTFYFTIPLA